MEKYIWIGHREAELFKTNDFFSNSITTWGSNANGNISYCQEYKTRNFDNELRNEFIANKLKGLLKDSKNKVMFYSSTLAYSLMMEHPEFEENFICLNSKTLLNLLNDKINTKLWISNHLPVLEFVLLSGHDCQFEQFKNFFPNHECFIIQEAKSSGGLGTFFVDAQNCSYVISQLKKDTLYLLSYFAYPSFSLNSHILITDNDVIVLPPSIQIIEKYGCNLIYSGADFVNYKYIEKKHREKIYGYSKKIGKLLQGIGYKGLCGIDYLVYNNEVYFVEINPRFQASTILLNIALNDAELPCIQMLQLSIFDGKTLPPTEKLENIDVNYSLYKYKKEFQDDSKQYLNKLALVEGSQDTEYILYDGFVDDEFSDGTYLYQVIWKRHISSCGKDCKLHLHPNIPLTYFMDRSLPLTQNIDDIIRLKIALLNQGVRILPDAYQQIFKSGGYNESVFNSIDLVFFNYLRINSPVNINLSSLSPFSIGWESGKYILYFYQILICEIGLEFTKSIENLRTKNNVPYKSIAFISGDRLRIKPERRCFFKMNKQGCLFCPGNGVSASNDTYTLSDIMEVIDYCIQNEEFRHILIGGGSANPSTDDNKILPVIKYIRSKTDKPIYLMSLPPNDIFYVDKYVEAGVDEIAFNLELFDRQLALEYMPGKGKISLNEYVSKLERAASLIPKTGNVRTMLMVGLEKTENTLAAIHFLTEKGIQPMISIFRPTPNCRLSYIVQPSNEELYNLFIEAEKICNLHKLSLGPTCPSCQNNTLSITLKQE